MSLSNLGVHAERFKREHSQVGVHLVVENTRRCCQAVSRGELDFAVVGGKIPADLQHLLLVRSILCLHHSVMHIARCLHSCSASHLYALWYGASQMLWPIDGT